MSTSDVILAVSPVVDALDHVEAPYYVGGSVASSAHGIARATLDVDVIADLRPEQAAPFAQILEGSYYVDADMIRDAIRRRSCFNVIHLETMLKVDVYVLPNRPFDRESFRRRQPDALDESDDRKFFLPTAEDVVLHKLEWYRSGGEISERQWGDVVGVLKVQMDHLDRQYLLRWAQQLKLDDLLHRAFADAGLISIESTAY